MTYNYSVDSDQHTQVHSGTKLFIGIIKANIRVFVNASM